MKTERRGFLKRMLGAIAAPLALRPVADLDMLKVPETPKPEPKPEPAPPTDLIYVEGDMMCSWIFPDISDMWCLPSDSTQGGI